MKTLFYRWRSDYCFHVCEDNGVIYSYIIDVATKTKVFESCTNEIKTFEKLKKVEDIKKFLGSVV